MMIAEYYHRHSDPQTALKHYGQAIEIRKKIYPKGHVLLTKHDLY